MTEKTSFYTYIREDQKRLLESENRPNTDVIIDALDMYFEAHGKGSVNQIESKLEELEQKREERREEWEAEDKEFKEEIEELRETLETRREMKRSVEDVKHSILEDMEEHPKKNIEAYQSEIQDLLSRPGCDITRKELISNLSEMATESGYDIKQDRLQAGVSDGPAVAADGDGAGDSELDLDKYDSEDGGGDS